MADLTFNTTAGQTVDRALLVLYLNTGESGTPEWSPVGKRVEDSSAEYDWSKESKTDIFGQVYTTLKKPTITQSFDPCELDAGDAAEITATREVSVRAKTPSHYIMFDMAADEA